MYLYPLHSLDRYIISRELEAIRHDTDTERTLRSRTVTTVDASRVFHLHRMYIIAQVSRSLYSFSDHIYLGTRCLGGAN